MDGMEEKISQIMGNPQMMNQIMAMAQALNQQGQSPPPREPPQSKPPAPPPGVPQLGKQELEMIRKLSAFSKQTGLNRDQQALLKALQPYLSHRRIDKLEKAMHAARLAQFASTALEQSGQSGSGR